MKNVKIVQGDFLNNLSRLENIIRKIWMNKPDIPEWKYSYNSTYGISGLLLYNYEESDAAFRIRIKQKKRKNE